MSALSFPLCRRLEEIDEGEDENPDQVDEVPVESDRLDAVEFGCRVASAERLRQNETQVHDAAEDVAPVKSRGHVEGRAKLRRTPGVGREQHAFVDQMVPLVG